MSLKLILIVLQVKAERTVDHMSMYLSYLFSYLLFAVCFNISITYRLNWKRRHKSKNGIGNIHRQHIQNIHMVCMFILYLYILSILYMTLSICEWNGNSLSLSLRLCLSLTMIILVEIISINCTLNQGRITSDFRNGMSATRWDVMGWKRFTKCAQCQRKSYFIWQLVAMSREYFNCVFTQLYVDLVLVRV